MPQSNSNSILTEIGNEVTNVVTPVSICMILTVVLVRLLNPDGESGSSTVIIATAVYKEQASDSDASKFFGSILNALVFVGVICVMTFVLFLLFKYGCVKVIYVYMGFAIFSIFFFFLGAIIVELLQVVGLHIDAVSLIFILYNISIVGTLGLFFWPAPLFLRQCYLVMVGVLVAYIFTWIPEWTTWILLVAMALYDLCAVLCPHGPLRALVELAQERQEDIPALVFEARPVQRSNNRSQEGEVNRINVVSEEEQQLEQDAAQQQGPVGEGIETELSLVVGITQQGASGSTMNQQRNNTEFEVSQQSQQNSINEETIDDIEQIDDAEDAVTPLIQGSETSGSVPLRNRFQPSNNSHQSQQQQETIVQVNENQNQDNQQQQQQQQQEVAVSEEGWGLPDAIKLGLGDFIFYSVLVGRAAMYDMMTVYAGYIAIIAGLVMTLLLLAVFKRALPALPISIALGMVFYFATRLVLQPFVVGCTLNLVFF